MGTEVTTTTLRVDSEVYAELEREVRRRKDAGDRSASMNKLLLEAVALKLSIIRRRKTKG